MTEDEIKTEFHGQEGNYNALEREALFVLNQAIEKNEIKTHSISARVKTLTSFIDKVKRKDVKEPFRDIQDIVGLRVVCLFLSDIPRVATAIKQSFNVVSEDNKIEGADVSSFGYMSYHLVTQMKEAYKGPRYDGIAGMPFEIQVRTILMDAWANVSHYLDYKTDIDVPRPLRRDFYALSGLFYVADSHFELFYNASKVSNTEMRELASSNKSELVRQEANLDSLTAYLRLRYPNRDHSDADGVSELLQELNEAGYSTLQQIDDVLDLSQKAFEAYEKEKPPANSETKRFADIGAVRISLSIADEKFDSVRRREGKPSTQLTKFRSMLPRK